jgi:2'-5' RNA ligase
VVRTRRGGKTRDCSLMVLIPRFGDKPRRRTIYIGTENTYTLARYHAALERAIEMRRAAEEAYEKATTRAKRADARAHKLLAK